MGDGSTKKKPKTKRAVRRVQSTNHQDEGSKQPTKVAGLRRKNSAVPTEDESTQKNPARRTSRLVAKKMSDEVEVACQDFVDHHDPATVREEYQTISDMVLGEHKACCEFKHRNRHESVPCLDATRVKITETSEPGCDFIHANKFVYEKADRDYILTQTPLQNTMEDFWRMVFQENSLTIVLIGRFYEQGKESCEQFWPTTSGQYKYYGRMFINNKKTEMKEAVTSYTLEVLPEACSNSIFVTLYHYENWETGSATPTRSILRLRNLLRLGEPGPMTVISSEGVNRASCFVAIDVVLSRLLKGFKTRLVDVAKAIRQTRALAFSSSEVQYLFAHQAALDYIRAKNGKFKEAMDKFNSRVNSCI